MQKRIPRNAEGTRPGNPGGAGRGSGFTPRIKRRLPRSERNDVGKPPPARGAKRRRKKRKDKKIKKGKFNDVA